MAKAIKEEIEGVDRAIEIHGNAGGFESVELKLSCRCESLMRLTTLGN